LVDRRSESRIVRATSTMARNLYRELRRADYSHQDVLRLVNEIVELLTSDAKGDQPAPPRAQPTLDRETGLPNAAVLREVLDFEVRHAREGQALLLLSLDVELPNLCPDAFAQALHESVSQALRRQVRVGESVGRIAPNRYLIVLPRATAEAALPLLRRISASFAGLESLRGNAAGVRIVARAAAFDASVHCAADLLERCVAAPPQPVFPLAASTEARARAGGSRAVVLALGGGAARAMAHLGALRVLRRAGVRIAGVAGASAGAIVGAMYASGVDDEAIIERFTAFARSDLYKKIRRSYATKRPIKRNMRESERYFRGSSLAFLSDERLGVVEDDLFSAFIEYFVGGDRAIESLSLPFAACATDLVEGRPAILAYGSVHAALRASCAIPGLFAPQRDGERLLVDGAVTSEVPIAAAAQLKLDAPTLAVYLERPERRVAQFANSAEIAIRANALVHTELVREQLRHAPLLLTVPVHDIGWLSFREGARLIEIGEKTAAAQLDRLLEELDRLSAAGAGG
jgi:NTE family protein